MGKRDPRASSFTVRGAGLLFIHKRDRADLQRGQRPAETGRIIGFHRSPRQWELARDRRGDPFSKAAIHRERSLAAYVSLEARLHEPRTRCFGEEENARHDGSGRYQRSSLVGGTPA